MSNLKSIKHEPDLNEMFNRRVVKSSQYLTKLLKRSWKIVSLIFEPNNYSRKIKRQMYYCLDRKNDFGNLPIFQMILHERKINFFYKI